MKKLTKEQRENYLKAKILIYDIEISPTLGWTYGQYETNVLRVEKEPILMSFSYKWLGDTAKATCETLSYVEAQAWDDRRLVKKLRDLFDEANLICGHNCVAAETPVLKADLTWVSAGTLKPGDELAAFEEGSPVGAKKHRRASDNPCPHNRNLRKAVVQSNHIERKDCLEIALSNGDKVVCTTDHPWLAMPKKSGLNSWYRAHELKVGMRLNKYFSVWEQNRDYESAWLSGFIAGEGSLNAQFHNIQICQRPTSTWKQCLEYLDKLNIPHCQPYGKTGGVGRGDCMYVNTRGGKFRTLEIVGRLGIRRFAEKVNWDTLGCLRDSSSKDSATEQVHIVGIRAVGKRDVAVLSTSTKTFFAAGYAMHNCDRFDNKVVTGKFIDYGLTPPSPYKTWDTLKMARKSAKFGSNKLDSLGKRFGEGAKTAITQGDIWHDFLFGDKATHHKVEKLLIKYNNQDVDLDEAVFWHLLPYHQSGITLGRLINNPWVCDCGCSEGQFHGCGFDPVGKYRRWQCNACGKWSKVYEMEKEVRDEVNPKEERPQLRHIAG